jgi:heptosyltransferase II
MRGAEPDSPGLLVVLPNWMGDVVLASPTLAALRTHFSGSRITFLLRRYVREIVEGCGWHDELVFWPDQSALANRRPTPGLTASLRATHADLALLLTNSFRSALAVWLAQIPRRVGYARDWRTLLLTDRLRPLKCHGEFVPASVLPYYAALAEHLGCPVNDRGLRLAAAPEQEEAGEALKRHYGLANGRYALINCGAKFGASKCWLPQRFAEVCRRIAAELSLTPVLIGAPPEYGLMREIAAAAGRGVICCTEPGTTLGSLKTVVAGAALMVCNDTGPRHYAIAYRIPTVTIFGPTHQEWTDTGYAGEIKLQASVECGPCQLPKCPLDLRCMYGITADMVLQAAAEVLQRRPSTSSPSGATLSAC